MAEIIHVAEFKDSRGNLVALDKEIPFEIKRVYFISSVPSSDIIRAGHSHKKTIQALVATMGSCTVSVRDKVNEEKFVLDSPNKCLLLPPSDWHTICGFSVDCVLLVLASEHYDADDYIDEFEL